MTVVLQAVLLFRLYREIGGKLQKRASFFACSIQSESSRIVTTAKFTCYTQFGQAQWSLAKLAQPSLGEASRAYRAQEIQFKSSPADVITAQHRVAQNNQDQTSQAEHSLAESRRTNFS